MAQSQYDMTRSQALAVANVARTAGSSIGGSAVRVTIDDSNCPSKNDALQMLEIIKSKIVMGTWPPSGS